MYKVTTMQQNLIPSWMTTNMIIACSSLEQCLIEYLTSTRQQSIAVTHLGYVKELSALAMVESNLAIGIYVFAVDAQEKLVLLHTPTYQGIENPMCIFFSGDIDTGGFRADSRFHLVTNLSKFVQTALRSHRRLNVCPRCLHICANNHQQHCRGRCDAYVPFVHLISRQCNDLHGFALMCNKSASRLALIQTCRGHGVTELRMIAKQLSEVSEKLNHPQFSRKSKKLYLDLFDDGCSYKLPQEYQEFAHYFR